MARRLSAATTKIVETIGTTGLKMKPDAVALYLLADQGGYSVDQEIVFTKSQVAHMAKVMGLQQDVAQGLPVAMVVMDWVQQSLDLADAIRD